MSQNIVVCNVINQLKLTVTTEVNIENVYLWITYGQSDDPTSDLEVPDDIPVLDDVVKELPPVSTIGGRVGEAWCCRHDQLSQKTNIPNELVLDHKLGMIIQ